MEKKPDATLRIPDRGDADARDLRGFVPLPDGPVPEQTGAASRRLK
jgi:hypothetical protein